MNNYRARKTKLAATGVYASLHSIKRLHNSPVVRERALNLERRYRDEIGDPSIVFTAASHIMTSNLRRKMLKAPKEPVSDPPPRWTYYNSTKPGDQIYVKKGRKAKKAVPYKSNGVIKFDYFRH